MDVFRAGTNVYLRYDYIFQQENRDRTLPLRRGDEVTVMSLTRLRSPGTERIPDTTQNAAYIASKIGEGPPTFTTNHDIPPEKKLRIPHDKIKLIQHGPSGSDVKGVYSEGDIVQVTQKWEHWVSIPGERGNKRAPIPVHTYLELTSAGITSKTGNPARYPKDATYAFRFATARRGPGVQYRSQPIPHYYLSTTPL